MSAQPTCKVCNSETIAMELEKVALFRCQKCGLISDNIMHTDEFLTDLYATMYGGETYYNQYLGEHDKLVKGEKVKLGWHNNIAIKQIDSIAAKKGKIKVLEFGAGIGVIGNHYKDNSRVDYDGMELDAKAASLARERGCNIIQDSITSDIEGSNKYDIVFSFEVIEHVVDLKKAVDNIKRLLKEDGVFIFSTPNYKRRFNYDDNKLHQEPPPVHVNFFDKENVVSLFNELDMKVERVYERPYPFRNSPFEHWKKTFMGKYNGATIVVTASKK